MIVKIKPDEIREELVSVGDLVPDDEWQIINDRKTFFTGGLLVTCFKNKGDEEQSIQQVNVSTEKHVKTKDPLFGWTATDRPLEIPPDNLDSASSTGTSIYIFVRQSG